MRTRSQARRRRQPQVRQTSVESSNLEKPDNPPIVTMADNRTMAQLLEAPTEGSGSDRPESSNHDAEVTKERCSPANNGSTETPTPVVQKFSLRNPNREPMLLCWFYSSGPRIFKRDRSGNPTPYFEPIVLLLLPISLLSATIFSLNGRSRFVSCSLEDEPVNHPPTPLQSKHISPGVRKELKLCEAKSSVDEPPEVILKELPPHLEYAFLEGDNKLPVIIAKDLKDEEKAALLKVLKSHKRAIAWKLSDIKGVSPEFCTPQILMEETYEPSVQSQEG
ncbi:hypothetical protein Tco_1431102 [Tanacetum coccineum]